MDNAAQQLKIIDLKLQSKIIKDEDVATLANIEYVGTLANSEKKQLAQEVWKTTKKLISNESDYHKILYPLHTSTCLYKICCNVARRQPQLAPEVFETFRTRLKSNKNNGATIENAYRSLRDIAHIPELRGEVFKTFRATVQSSENDMSTLDEACRVLDLALKDNPSLELASEIRTTAKTILQSDKLDYQRNDYGRPRDKAKDLLYSCRDYVADQKLLTFEEFFDGCKPYGEAGDFVISEAKKLYETFKTPDAIMEFHDAYHKAPKETAKKCNLQYEKYSYHGFDTVCISAVAYAKHVQQHSKKAPQKNKSLSKIMADRYYT